jgi:hypothetical protein
MARQPEKLQHIQAVVKMPASEGIGCATAFLLHLAKVAVFKCVSKPLLFSIGQTLGIRICWNWMVL